MIQLQNTNKYKTAIETKKKTLYRIMFHGVCSLNREEKRSSIKDI